MLAHSVQWVVQVNPNNEVLDNNGQAIAGLYAIGNDATGLVGDTYGPNMPGTCVGYAFYSGRNAGLHAAMTVNNELEDN